MPFPVSLTLITLSGEFLRGDSGEPREGVVTITLPTPIRSEGDNIIIPPFDLEVPLVTGVFSVEIPATTDADWMPNTAEYVVQATFSDDYRKLWWAFPLPWDTPGAALDLADVGEPNVGTPSLTIRQGTGSPVADGGYRGTWFVTSLYLTGDTVQHGSSVYGALKASSGVTPGTNAAVWKVYPSSGGGGGAVSSVFSRTGDVVAQTGDYTKAQVGLGNVDNTSDVAKPVSTAQAAADTTVATNAANALTAHSSDTTGIHGIADTSLLALTSDPRFTDTRTPTDGTVTTAKIVDGNVTLAKLANIAASTILGNNTGGAAAPIALTTAQVKTLLAIAQSDVAGLVAALAAKQDLDSDLTTIAGLTATTDNIIQSVGSAWASRTPAQVKTALAITQSDVSGLTAALALLAPLASPALTGTATAVNLTQSGRYLSTPDTLTDAATIAVDASLGNDFTVTLGGNRTLGNPTNPSNGQKILFAIRQDGTGNRTLTLDTAYRLGTDIASVVLSTAANKTDYIGVRYNSTDSKWDVIAFVKGY